MDNNILNIVITVSAIMIALSISLIVYLLTNHAKNKDLVLGRMRAYYPKLRYFNELIYQLHHIDFWKPNKELDAIKDALRNKNKEKIKELKNSSGLFSTYYSYWYFSKKYEDEIMNEKSTEYNYLYTFKEIEEYKIWSNNIWYSIDSSSDIIDYIDTRTFDNINGYKKERIEKLITKINTDYNNTPISIHLIAQIAGDIEVETLIPLYYLTHQYEKPINSMIKWINRFLVLFIIVGVIIPMIMLFMKTIYETLILIGIVLVLILCMLGMIVLIWAHIKVI